MKLRGIRIGSLLVSGKKMMLSFVLLVLGIGFIFNGLLSFYIDHARFSSKMTDEEIIERAKGLGMVDLKEYIKNKESLTNQ